MSITSSASPGLSGWGYADIHAGVNFAFWDFCELRIHGVLGSCNCV
jgi:hypothetical protein